MRLVSASLQLFLLATAVVVVTLAGGETQSGRAQADPDYPRWGPAQARPGASAPAARAAANAVSTCPAAPAYSFSVPDPTGDAFSGFGLGPALHDITSVAVAGDATTFCLTLSFAATIEPPAFPPSERSLFGFVEFDTDANFNTGFIPSIVDVDCPDFAIIGVEITLDLFSFFEGTAFMIDPFTGQPTQPVPVTFSANSFTAEIPVTALGGDTSFNFATIIGTEVEPTDCAPNGGSIHSPDGSIVPAPQLPDRDGDGAPDIVDNCPDIANADQIDSDFDFIGDVCDPTPTHDIAITRVRPEGARLELDRDEDDDDDDDDDDNSGAGAGLPTAEIEVDVTVKNLLDQPENVFVGIGFAIESMPPGCLPAGDPSREFSLRSGKRKTVELVALIACDPTVATPGKYTLNFEVFAFPAGGADLDESNNFVEKTVRLRLRD